MHAALSSPARNGFRHPHEHDEFLALQPIVERHNQIVFRHLPAADREEAVAEAVAAAFASYVQLKARGRDALKQFPTALAAYAALHVKDDRHVGGTCRGTDALSKKAQRRHGFRVQSLPLSTRRSFEELSSGVAAQRQLDAFEERLQDNTRTPVPDQAAFRIDFPLFLQGLTERDRRLAEYLALGYSAKQAADQFGLTPGRITQLRQEWCREWHAFHSEPAPFEDRSSPTCAGAA